MRAIVARAMEKDRENRYGSAAQLGEDVRRFLRWEPVTARHASLLHHLRLLWRRRRALMLAVWLLLAVLVAAVVVSSGHAFRAQEAQRREAVEAYLAHIAAADGALRLHRTSEARAHLRQASPALRGWEWELLASRLDASIASYEIPGSAHVEFDPAGDRVVLAGPGNAFSAAVFGSAKLVHQEGLHSRAWRPVYSADGRMIAFGHDDGSVSLRDARTYAAVALFEDHNAQAVQVAFRPDGKQIAACYTDGALLAWDLPSGRNVIRQSGKPADRIVYSPDGKRILVGTRDGRIVIWDVGLRKRQRTIDAHRGAVNFLAPLPADGIIVSGGDDARLALWDSNTGHRRSVHAARDARILCGELVPGGRRAVTGHSDGTLTVWDLETGLVNAVLPGHAGAVSSVAVSPDGRSIVSTGNQFVKVWNMPAPGDAPQGRYPRVVRAVAFDPAGERLAIAIWDHTVRVRSLTGAFEEYTLEGHVAAVQAVEFSPDGSALASGGNDGVRIWDLESRECRVHQPSPSGGAVVGLAFDEAGTTLAWGDWNGLACLWDVESERVTQTHQQPGPVKDVLFLPGGRLWAAVAHPGEIRVWDRASGAEVRSIRLDSRTVGGAELSRDGKRLAVAAQDSIFLYDTTTWALQARHALDGGDLVTVSWGRDDRRLAVGTASGVQILDPVSGRTVLTDPTRSWIWDLRFSPGGEQLAIGTGSYGRGYCAALCIGRTPGEAWPRPLVRKDESR